MSCTLCRSLAAVGAVLALSAGHALAQAPPPPRRGLVWNERPSIVFGEDLHVDLRAKFAFDWRGFDPHLDEDRFQVNVMRFGLKGELTRHVDFEVEIEADVAENEISLADWRDVYLNWDTFDAFSIRGGRFKMPFGMEQNIGRTDLDFVYRTRMSTQLTPNRDKGMSVHGRRFGRGLTYEFGVFDTDGDNGKLEEEQFPTGDDTRLGPTIAARVTAAVLRPLVGADAALGSLRVGAGYTNGRLPEGLNSLRGETPYGFDYFEPVYVKGRRQRFGLDLDWTPGPYGLRAEWIQSREDRREQGLGDRDLSDFVGTGWFVSGTWIVTGQDKDDNISMRRSLIHGGPGAIELAARYEELGFGSASNEGVAFRNPRADHLLENEDRIWTVGVNWYPAPHLKVVANAIHEAFEDEARTPKSGDTTFWSGVLRIQVVF